VDEVGIRAVAPAGELQMGRWDDRVWSTQGLNRSRRLVLESEARREKKDFRRAKVPRWARHSRSCSPDPWQRAAGTRREIASPLSVGRSWQPFSAPRGSRQGPSDEMDVRPTTPVGRGFHHVILATKGGLGDVKEGAPPLSRLTRSGQALPWSTSAKKTRFVLGVLGALKTSPAQRGPHKMARNAISR